MAKGRAKDDECRMRLPESVLMALAGPGGLLGEAEVEEIEGKLSGDPTYRTALIKESWKQSLDTLAYLVDDFADSNNDVAHRFEVFFALLHIPHIMEMSPEKLSLAKSLTKTWKKLEENGQAIYYFEAIITNRYFKAEKRMGVIRILTNKHFMRMHYKDGMTVDDYLSIITDFKGATIVNGHQS